MLLVGAGKPGRNTDQLAGGVGVAGGAGVAVLPADRAGVAGGPAGRAEDVAAAAAAHRHAAHPGVADRALQHLAHCLHRHSHQLGNQRSPTYLDQVSVTAGGGAVLVGLKRNEGRWRGEVAELVGVPHHLHLLLQLGLHTGHGHQDELKRSPTHLAAAY